MPPRRHLRTFVYSRYRPGARTVARYEVNGLVLTEFALLTFKPKLIVELGTGHFGLTAIFHETDLDIEIHTFDSSNYVDRSDLAGKGLTNEELAIFRNKVFEDGKTKFYIEDVLTKENQKVVDLLKRPEKKLLFCDNGSKVHELSMYAKYLSKWDILGVHDWGFEYVGYDNPTVKEVLESGGFEYQHHVNDLFEERQCSSRFFVKEPYIG